MVRDTVVMVGTTLDGLMDDSKHILFSFWLSLLLPFKYAPFVVLGLGIAKECMDYFGVGDPSITDMLFNTLGCGMAFLLLKFKNV